MTKTDLDNIVEGYVRRLEAALSPLPELRRQQLVSEITEHLAEARSTLQNETEAALRELLDRVGQPEEIAAEALADQPRNLERPRRISRLMFGGAGLVLLVGIGAALTLLLIIGGRSAKPLRPTRAATPVVYVPNVVGQLTTQATGELLASGLQMTAIYKASNAIADNTVMAQAPAAGSKVVRGTRITLTVSSGNSFASAAESPATDHTIVIGIDLGSCRGCSAQK